MPKSLLKCPSCGKKYSNPHINSLDSDEVVCIDCTLKKTLPFVLMKLRKLNKSFPKYEIIKTLSQTIKKGVPLELLTAGAISFSKQFCGGCGDCCRTLTPIDLSCFDIERISKHLAIPIPKFYIEYVAVVNENFVIKKTEPCQFLNKKKQCTIYSVRPDICSTYPLVPHPITGTFVGRPNCTVISKIFAEFTVGNLIFERLPLEKRKELSCQARKDYEFFYKKAHGNSKNIAFLILQRSGRIVNNFLYL